MLYDYDELTFQVLSVSRIKWDSGQYEVKPRSFGALAFRENGYSDFKTDDRIFTVKKGEILYLPAGIGYNVKYSNVEMIVIHFSDCNYLSTAENYTFQNPEFFHRKFLEILDAWEKHSSLYKIKALIYNLLDAMHEDKKRASFEDPVFNDCFRIINEQFTNSELNLAKLCQSKGMSESTFRRKFHQYQNASPKQYLRKLRLNKAVSLLAENSYTIAEVASMCGFQDEKYFSRVIKNEYGIAPSVLSRKFKV